MPWTAADAPKRLTPKQARKWAEIANAVYKDCMKKSTDKVCAPRAIKIANSKFSEDAMNNKETVHAVPKGALRFVDVDCHAFAVKDGTEAKPKLNMVAYTGGIIKGHWYWGNLAIDLSGMKFPLKRYPILEDHRTDKKIAFTVKPVIVEGKLTIDPDKTEFVDTEESAEFQRLSKEGFPYQSSIYAVPEAVERLEEGVAVDVNGFKMKGPGTVWRQSVFKEASVCVFGWDSQTQSSAFSREVEEDIEFVEKKGGELENKQTEGVDTLTITEKEVKKVKYEDLKKDFPDLFNQVIEEGKKFAQTAADIQIQQLTSENTTLKAQHEKDNDRMLSLEKKETIRTEREIRLMADNIWTKRLASSNIPEHLFDKVRSQVSYSRFVKDAILDEGAFSAAVDAEITDWEDKGVVVSSVQGTGLSSRTADNSNAPVAEENKKLTNNLLRLAGQKAV
jgi:hypothetical protein